MKKLLFASLLTVALVFAQATGGSTDKARKLDDTTTASAGKRATRSRTKRAGKKGAVKDVDKKGKKSSGGTTTPPPK